MPKVKCPKWKCIFNDCGKCNASIIELNQKDDTWGSLECTTFETVETLIPKEDQK